MTEKPSETVVRAWARLLRAQQLALAAMQRALKGPGLPPLAWYDVILEVERAGPLVIRPFELERAMLLAQYNLSRLLGCIESIGYLERRTCPDDRRGQIIHITKAGKVIRRKMWLVYARAIEPSLGRHLSAKQSEALDNVLGRVVERLTVKRAPALDSQRVPAGCVRRARGRRAAREGGLAVVRPATRALGRQNQEGNPAAL